jgi:hypothetical protein
MKRIFSIIMIMLLVVVVTPVFAEETAPEITGELVGSTSLSVNILSTDDVYVPYHGISVSWTSEPGEIDVVGPNTYKDWDTTTFNWVERVDTEPNSVSFTVPGYGATVLNVSSIGEPSIVCNFSYNDGAVSSFKKLGVNLSGTQSITVAPTATEGVAPDAGEVYFDAPFADAFANNQDQIVDYIMTLVDINSNGRGIFAYPLATLDSVSFAN